MQDRRRAGIGARAVAQRGDVIERGANRGYALALAERGPRQAERGGIERDQNEIGLGLRKRRSRIEQRLRRLAVFGLHGAEQQAVTQAGGGQRLRHQIGGVRGRDAQHDRAQQARCG